MNEELMTTADVLAKYAPRMDAPVIMNTGYEAPAGVGDFELISYEDVEDREVSWLWEPYIQAGNISLLRGNPGAGKTYFIAAIMAAIANGYQPEGMPGKLHRLGDSDRIGGRCIYFGKQDDPEVFKRRLKNAGCTNLRNLYPFSKQITFKDIPMIRELINRTGADLIVFDPIQSYLDERTDMKSANELEPLLDNLRELARETNCAVLIVEHMNKNQNGDPIYRGIGSMTIAGAARSILMITRDDDDKSVRYIEQIKTNDREGDVITWSIEENGRFIWRGAVDSFGLEARRELDGIPAAKLIKEIIKKHPDGWGGRTIKELLEECPEIDSTSTNFDYKMAIGRELNNSEIRSKIQRAFGVVIDITNTGNRKNYHIYKP